MHSKAQPIELAGRTLYVAPLTMRQLETLVDGPNQLQAQLQLTMAEHRKALWAQIEAALVNADAGNPSIEELKDQLDLADWLKLLQKMREVSHLVVVEPVS